MLYLVCFLLGLAPAASAESGSGKTLLVLGDSLSAAYGLPTQAGWVSLLGERLTARGLGFRVVNASISGETSAGGLARLPALLADLHPEVVVIALGANDGLRGFAFETLQANLTRMVELARASGARVMLAGVRLPPNYGASYTQGFEGVFRQVAQERAVPLAPYLLAEVAEDLGLMQADGLHPTAEAQPRILDNIWPVLEPLLTPAGSSAPGLIATPPVPQPRARTPVTEDLGHSGAK